MFAVTVFTLIVALHRVARSYWCWESATEMEIRWDTLSCQTPTVHWAEIWCNLVTFLKDGRPSIATLISASYQPYCTLCSQSEGEGGTHALRLMHKRMNENQVRMCHLIPTPIYWPNLLLDSHSYNSVSVHAHNEFSPVFKNLALNVFETPVTLSLYWISDWL